MIFCNAGIIHGNGISYFTSSAQKGAGFRLIAHTLRYATFFRAIPRFGFQP
jgi:hypothetical protein